MPKQIEIRGKRVRVRYTEGEFMALLTLSSRSNPDNKLELWIPRHNAEEHLLELEIEISMLLKHIRKELGSRT